MSYVTTILEEKLRNLRSLHSAHVRKAEECEAEARHERKLAASTQDKIAEVEAELDRRQISDLQSAGSVQNSATFGILGTK